jgi:S1-C subfamily serine protease
MDTAASEGSGSIDASTQAYAIPISTALSIAKQIVAGKSSPVLHIGATGFIGVSVSDSSSSSNSSGSGGFGSGSFGGGFGGTSGGSGNTTTTPGAVVESVVSGSAGAQAGLAEGDVITGVNGNSIKSSSDLSNQLQSHHPGDTVQLHWTDASGQTHSASVTLTSGPPA